MTAIRQRAFPITLILIALAAVPGCRRGEEETITIKPVAFTPEQVQAMKTEDQRVDQEEGGAERVTRPANARKVR